RDPPCRDWGLGLLTQKLGYLAEGTSLPLLFEQSGHEPKGTGTKELSLANSDLQMLKEELEGLNISVGVYQNTEILSWNITVKMAICMKMKLQILWI
uniref:Uncharacterized protein n=1 Tax=Macaca fascicularis TaxID=9541 RepID=A0A7N9DB58_MACFA